MTESAHTLYLFITSQVGLLLTGVLIGSWLGAGIRRELRNLIDRWDGQNNHKDTETD